MKQDAIAVLLLVSLVFFLTSCQKCTPPSSKLELVFSDDLIRPDVLEFENSQQFSVVAGSDSLVTEIKAYLRSTSDVSGEHRLYRVSDFSKPASSSETMPFPFLIVYEESPEKSHAVLTCMFVYSANSSVIFSYRLKHQNGRWRIVSGEVAGMS